MTFTARILTSIWYILRNGYLFAPNPDAPTLETFLAHYAAPGVEPSFIWPDRAKGLSFLYDLTINQVQATPDVYPYPERVAKANVALWNFLTPEMLEDHTDWAALWFKALEKFDFNTMTLCTEQGFDASAQVSPADWTRLWFRAAGVAHVKIMRLILEQSFDINTRDQHGESALEYVVGLYGGSYDAVEFLVDAGIPVTNVDKLIEMGSKSVTCGSEASEQTKIANYLTNLAAGRSIHSSLQKD